MQNNEDFYAVLSAISHEVRNPVTLINSYLQILSKNHPEICDDPYWEIVLREMSHLKCILRDMTVYQNVTRLNAAQTDMGMWLREYADAVGAVLSQKPYVTFTYDAAPDLPCIRVDQSKLRQVLDNLLRNALEAVEAAGAGHSATSAERSTTGCFQIALYADSADGFLRLRVRDTGCGIPDDTLGTLFEPFVTHKPDGTGLGLAIARQIVQAHGGSLICSSCGNPTEFQIMLPAQSRPGSRPNAQSDPPLCP